MSVTGYILVALANMQKVLLTEIRTPWKNIVYMVNHILLWVNFPTAGM